MSIANGDSPRASLILFYDLKTILYHPGMFFWQLINSLECLKTNFLLEIMIQGEYILIPGKFILI